MNWGNTFSLSICLILAGRISAATPPTRGGMSVISTPYVIAHRGGSLLWPEHTMEAYQASTRAGNQFVELDCFVLRDGSVVIMHDNELEKTTTGHGTLTSKGAKDVAGLSVDGERLLGPGWGKYHIPFLDEALVHYANQKILFVEVKTPKGGKAIAKKLKQYHVDKDFAVVNSFYPDELNAARAEGYRTCLNLRVTDKYTVDQLAKMRLWAISCHTTTSEDFIRALKKVGLRVLIYTPENHYERDAALAKAADGFYCDDPIYMALDTGYIRDKDPFRLQKWYPGMLPAVPGGRGRFSQPDKWGIDTSTENVYRGCLQGWLSPMRDGKFASEWNVELSVTFGIGLMEGRWAGLGVFTTDQPLVTDAPTYDHKGYNFIFHNSGSISIFKYDGVNEKNPKLLGVTPTGKVTVGVTRRYKITINPRSIKAECYETGAVMEVEDDSYRGAYITLGTKGQKAEFSNIRLTVP